MKSFLTTTAMVLALGLPVNATFADTTTPANKATTTTTTTTDTNSAGTAAAGTDATTGTATAGTTATDTTNAGTTATGTAASGTTATADANSAANTGFLVQRTADQMLATDLIGHDVYARRTPMDKTAAGTKHIAGTPMGTMTTADLEGMDNVGQIKDLVMSSDGTVAAIVIGVGGFLGLGDRDVAVNMNEVTFATNADQNKDMFIVVNTTGDMMKTSPPFDLKGNAAMDASGTNQTATTGAATDQTATTGAATDPNAAASTTATTDRALLKAPAMTRNGYNTVKVSDVSIDTLIGKTVYGPDDKSVAKVSDVTVDSSGAVQKVIIDFGGFLGMGTTKVALNFDELTILTNSNKSDADIRVYVDATKDQIKAMPVYKANN
jgi:sporulation protein YlmC with PRC-barrel domain